jgi:UDP-GlcNAc:undecaprenyl-phosphate/decaprenyl-phosphate GlcNAc-1-phosphate transferase
MNFAELIGTIWQQLSALVGAFLIALVLTPVVRRIAIRMNLVDRPDPHRKLHKEAVALSGGVAVFLSLGLAAGIATLASESIRDAVAKNPLPVFGLAVSSLGIVLLGLIDDAVTLRGRQKLFGQLLLVTILVGCGFQMKSISFLGWQADLGLLVIPVSIGWLLLTVNALNLIDGADGLCSTVGWTAAAGMAAMATLGQHNVEASIAAALCGALLGFLVYNFPPAKIFLGDAGSMLIGLLLGGLALRTSLKGPTAISLFGTVAILAIPIFDSSMAIVRRKLTGRSIFTVDRGHLHHNLMRAGITNRRLVALMTVMCGVIAIGAFAGAVLNSELIALMSVTTVLGALVASRIFGFAELKLILHRAKRFGGSLMFRPKGSKNDSREQTVRLQGFRAWETLWLSITEFAEKHQLGCVCLDLNVPWLHEGFHAQWQKNKLPEAAERWNTSLPVISKGRMLGRLEVMGPTQSYNFFETLGMLAELMESLQPEIDRLATDTAASADSTELDSAIQESLSGYSDDSGSNRDLVGGPDERVVRI